VTEGLHSLRAAAIVELREKKTEKGRAIITVSAPDSFRIEIKGPFGTTSALITGNGSGLTFASRGKRESFAPLDPRLPLKVRPRELVALLLGSTHIPARQGTTAVTKKITGGRQVTIRDENSRPLYSATMRDYRVQNGVSLPFNITIEGKDYKLIVKYLHVDINPYIKKITSQETNPE